MIKVPCQMLALTTDSRSNTLLADLLTLFKKHARIDFSDDDDLCTMYLAGAISRAEQYTEMPIAPVAYNWSYVGPVPAADKYLLPLRNCVLAGEQMGFELLIAPKWIEPPTSWPVKLEAGFASGATLPLDLKLAIFQIALAFYEMRSTPEMLDVYATQVMNGSLARYVVPRV